MLLSKFFSKYSKESKVKADKFVDKVHHVEEVAAKTQAKPVNSISSGTISQINKNSVMTPPPPPLNSTKPLPPKNNNEHDFSNLFSNAQKPQEEIETKSSVEAYCKEVIDSVMRHIKVELGKHQRDVRVNLNMILMLGSASVYYKGRTEYDYVIQVKAGKSPSTSSVIVKGSGERGGLDLRKSLSGLTIEEVKKEEFIKDFLTGYKGYMNHRGWM